MLALPVTPCSTVRRCSVFKLARWSKAIYEQPPIRGTPFNHVSCFVHKGAHASPHSGRSMTEMPVVMTFSPAERDYIRRELDMFFSTFPTVAEGFQLKTWRGGPLAGQPKVPPAAKSLLDRGLMRLDASSRIARLFFTDKGLDELRVMMADKRLANQEKFAHVRRELGLDD